MLLVNRFNLQLLNIDISRSKLIEILVVVVALVVRVGLLIPPLALQCLRINVDLHITVFGDIVDNSVLDLFVFINEFSEWNLLEQRRASQLQHRGYWYHGGTGDYAGAPLTLGQRGGSREQEEDFNHDDLEADDEEDGEPEVPVELREYSLEDVELTLADLPAVDVVEHLQEHEGPART